MKTVTRKQIEQIHIRLGAERLFASQKYWSALDVLNNHGIRREERLRLVLREELIDYAILQEFACWCAEDAFHALESHVYLHDLTAVEIKRKWLKREATDEELEEAHEQVEAILTQVWDSYSFSRGADWWDEFSVINVVCIAASKQPTVQLLFGAQTASAAAKHYVKGIDMESAYQAQIEKLKEML